MDRNCKDCRKMRGKITGSKAKRVVLQSQDGRLVVIHNFRFKYLQHRATCSLGIHVKGDGVTPKDFLHVYYYNARKVYYPIWEDAKHCDGFDDMRD
jgi:hypothetical protein